MVRDRKRIETEALIVGYAMSKLGAKYLNAFGFTTWRQVYEQASAALAIPESSFKNLRDEFDPYLSTERRGWHGRAIRPNRQAVINELSEVSEPALLELVRRSIERDTKSIDEVVDIVLKPPKRMHNVAERLLTGRMAEEYFLQNSQPLVNCKRELVLDCRQLACGYDFGVTSKPSLAIEVKGLRKESGGIIFTDREWSEAQERQANYLLVLIGNLATNPHARLIYDPAGALEVKCEFVRTSSAVWRTNIHV